MEARATCSLLWHTRESDYLHHDVQAKPKRELEKKEAVVTLSDKSHGKDQHFNKAARELELVFNTIQERNRHCLDEICKQNRFRAFGINSKDVNKAFSI
jgi:hypothetical protein